MALYTRFQAVDLLGCLVALQTAHALPYRFKTADQPGVKKNLDSKSLRNLSSPGCIN